jgi:S1-C subfamily serine protease
MKVQQLGVAGISFAIPIDTAAQVIEQLRNTRKVVRCGSPLPFSASLALLQAMRMPCSLLRLLRLHVFCCRPYIGMKMLTFDAANPQAQLSAFNAAGAPTGVTRRNTRGVVVVETIPSSPAQKSGLQSGDLIISFDSMPCYSTRDILSRVGFHVGRSVPVRIERDGKELELAIVTSSSE